MKIILAIDSLKGCLSSAEANRAAAGAVREVHCKAEIVECTVSDGGEGWIDAWGTGEVIETTVHDPLMRPIRARYLKQGEVAVVEIAQACGLTLLRPEERNPLSASSYGVGELIADGLKRGCTRFIVGLGGSATSDAGQGMLKALKDVDARGVTFTIATDVGNPLYGERGAAAIFAPQKGATPSMVRELDARARLFAESNAREMGFDRSQAAGAGAAGGLGYAFMQFFNADCRPGAELLLDTLHFDHLLKDADLVITGEGHADRQTLMGKLPCHILNRARAKEVPCHLIAGGIQDADILLAAGFASIHEINPPTLPLKEALKPETAKRKIAWTVQQLLR